MKKVVVQNRRPVVREGEKTSGDLQMTNSSEKSSKVSGSSTGFLTTADWYEEQTESFRSELDDMILIHDYTKNRFTPELSEDEQQVIIKNNMCPERSELPMVMQSPGGIKGLHYTITSTVAGIKGATDSEFKKITDNIN